MEPIYETRNEDTTDFPPLITDSPIRHCQNNNEDFDDLTCEE